MRRLFIFCLCLLIFCGFSYSTNQNDQQSYQLEPFIENPRVFYGETGYPTEDESYSKTCESLSLEEINIIQKLVSEKTQKPIWFVRIPLSSSKDHRNQLWVYLAPDVMNTRYRSGQAYTIEIYKFKETDVRTITDPSWQYIQVSLPNKEFGSLLETPKVHDLPFRYPPQKINDDENEQEILTKEEIIHLIDYIRDPNSYLKFKNYDVISREPLPGGGVRTKISSRYPRPDEMSEHVMTKPLVSINKYSDEIIVNFGFIHHGLYARCTRITLKVTKDGYEIIDWGMWIS